MQGEELESDLLHSVAWIELSELEKINKVVQLANDYLEVIKKLKQISEQLVEGGWA